MEQDKGAVRDYRIIYVPSCFPRRPTLPGHPMRQKTETFAAPCGRAAGREVEATLETGVNIDIIKLFNVFMQAQRV